MGHSCLNATPISDVQWVHLGQNVIPAIHKQSTDPRFSIKTEWPG